MSLYTSLVQLLPPIITPKSIDMAHDIAPLADKTHKYDLIMDECLEALHIHLAVMEWIKRFTGIVPGDCWNISAICAALTSSMGMQPLIIGISGPRLEHMECMTPAGGNMYRFWWVSPYNHVGHFRFIVSPPIPLELYKLYWEVTHDVSHFSGPYECKDGYDVQKRLIDWCHPENTEAVMLVNMDKVMEALRDGNYDIIYKE